MRKIIRIVTLLIVLALLVPPSSTIASSKINQPQHRIATSIDTFQVPSVPNTGESTTNSSPYYLSNTDVADAPYGSTTLELDGKLSPGEYAHAHRLTFPTYGGEAEVFIVQNAYTLTIGIDSPDTTPFPYDSGEGTGPALQVFLDTKHDHGTAPKTDDYRLTILKNGNTSENQGIGSAWGGMVSPDGWKAAKQDTSWGWQAEFSIGFNKLGITSTVAVTHTIGLALAEVWTQPHTVYNPKDWYWPKTATYNRPDTWANLISSSWWSTFYWKPGPWEDYAPSGIPDFDQNQDNWMTLGPGPGGGLVPILSHCGPVAVANSLWWFDSKFETPDHSPGVTISDTYPLVQSYGAWDDHDPNNVIPFVDDLANNYFETNNGIVGTDILKMNAGLQKYLREKGLWDDYSVTLVKKPSFAWVADEVQRSQDVVLLLGFWQLVSQDYFQRVGGHYVTVAGVNPQQQLVAFSDPMLDNAESNPGAGYVYTGTLITHSPIPGHPSNIHNDSGNVSHDVYAAAPVPPTWNTAGTWMLPNYHALLPLFGANPHPNFPNQQYIPGPEHPVVAVVEFALAVSPYSWKASGWKDYAPNGLPDIGQKQDNWKNITQQWSYCGPVAAANSLWWFDSKFEPSPAAPPAYNDNYALIKSYDTMLPPWDDHDPLNVDNPAIGSQFVDDLAAEFKTDVAGPGTVITDVRTGIVNYMKERVIDPRYTVKQVKAPDFWWVADEVERSEDVILLLGFWEGGATGQYHRLGGHYVTVSGVDKKGGEIAFSDPWFNRIEQTWPYAGTPVPGPGVPTCDPCYMGRAADGTLILPHTIPHPVGLIETLHNDAGNVSHDIYYVASTTSPGGSWGPLAYANSWAEIENFYMQNGGGSTSSGGPIQTEVEWAIAVSPATMIFLPVVMR